MNWPAVLTSFTPEELASPDNGKWGFHPGFPEALQNLRDLIGRPLLVASCCRSWAHNQTLKNSSPASLHIYDHCQRAGQRGTLAIDLKVKDNNFRHWVLSCALPQGWSGYIIPGGNLHLDMRKLIGEKPAFWI